MSLDLTEFAPGCGVWKNISACGCLLWGIKKRNPPWHAISWNTVTHLSPVQTEARVGLNGLVKNLHLHEPIQSVPRPRAKAGWDVQGSPSRRQSGGAFGLWGVIYPFIFIEHLLCTRHCTSRCGTRLARFLPSWNLPSCGEVLQTKHRPANVLISLFQRLTRTVEKARWGDVLKSS